MSYQSVDKLQRVLAGSVFHYAKDAKKASGRALGTLVEIITFYLLKTWNLERYVAIERSLPEYQNPDITHNVEYSLHPSSLVVQIKFKHEDLPLSSTKIVNCIKGQGADLDIDDPRGNQLLTRDLILRNACTVANVEGGFLVAVVTSCSRCEVNVAVHRLLASPFAVVECKRVGIEEGTRKGPQTIEKAKQGAYVAKAISALQKIRLSTGEMAGVLHKPTGKLVCRPYSEFLREIICSNQRELLKQFVLTVGVVSNHGNWFTSENHNKELKVLAQSYDWLLFLTDEGLSEFIHELVLHPSQAYRPVRKAFLASYKGRSGANQFTKVQMNLEADALLQRFFSRNLPKVQDWFNVISPHRKGLLTLRGELHKLAGKDWSAIHK